MLMWVRNQDAPPPPLPVEILTQWAWVLLLDHVSAPFFLFFLFLLILHFLPRTHN